MNNADMMAFPLVGIDTGLTKREYFAGLAMAAILADFKVHLFNTHQDHHKKVVAELSLSYADALLKELDK